MAAWGLPSAGPVTSRARWHREVRACWGSRLLASLAFGRGLGRGVAALRVVLPISDAIGLSARGSAGQPVPKLVVGLGLADQVAARLGRLAAASEEGSGLQRRQVQVNRPL